MSSPRPGRINLGGLAGLAVGGTGGLFSLGVVPAIVLANPRLLFNTPTLNVLCWIASLVVGWLAGTYLGYVFGRKYQTQRAEITGGIVAGVLTVLLGSALGWFLWHLAPE